MCIQFSRRAKPKLVTRAIMENVNEAALADEEADIKLSLAELSKQLQTLRSNGK